MRCAALRTTVQLALAGFRVWSVHHMFGPFPTSYTWGYYRADVSCLFGNWLTRSYMNRAKTWAHALTQAHTCDALQAHGKIGISTADNWMFLRTCFHMLMNDPPYDPTHTVQDAGTGLRNVLLWDLAFLVYAKDK